MGGGFVKIYIKVGDLLEIPINMSQFQGYESFQL